MKNKLILNKLFSISLMFVVIFLLTNCKSKKDDPGPSTPTSEVADNLKSGTWIIQNVSVDNVDRTSNYAGMTLSFTASSFNASKGAPVWPSSGTWTLNADDSSITRGDGLLLIIQEASATSLKLGLVWTQTTYGPGKQASVSGNHVFTFSH